MWIIKLAGMILLFSACTAFGFLSAGKLTRRVDALKKTDTALEEVGQRLRFERSERRRLLTLSFGESGILNFSGKEITVESRFLSPEDRAVLTDFLQKFGSGGTDTECDRVKLCRALLARQLEQAEEAAGQGCRLYRTFGICIGAGLCLLLW